MKKFISFITMLFFLMVPSFALAEGVEGAQTTGKDSSVKAEKVTKKTSKSKKKPKKVTKKTKHTKKKANKPMKQDEPMKGMGTMPAHP